MILETIPTDTPAHRVANLIADRYRLTVREAEIVGLLACGHRVPTIAATLYLSAGTIRNQLSRIYHKVGVRSQAELAAMIVTTDRTGTAP